MSLYSFVGKPEYESTSSPLPKYSGLQLLALEVLLDEYWDSWERIGYR